MIFAAACLALVPLRADTVLVLPFFNLSNSSNLDWIGESLAETIRESLGAHGVLALDREERVEAFRRLSIRPYALLTRASVIKLAESLDAGQVIFGQYSVSPGSAQSQGSLRITSRILDLKRIKQGPELNELGALEDLAAIETHLAWQALRALAPKTALSEEQFRMTRPSLRVDAIENYIRGLVAVAPDQKHRFFTQAARLDARFSQPCFQLGRIYTQKKDYRVALGWLERVDRLDSHYFEAQFLLGICRYYTGDFAGAEAAFKAVSESVPLNEVFNNLGAAQSRRDQPQTLENLKKALEGDDADPDYHFNIGYALWKRGQFDAAADSFRAALDRKPNDADATLMLGRCLSKSAPRAGDPKHDGLERLKLNYEETAYRQLKAELGVK
jgi:tetratricopeptide (TPR) repeat protein